MTELSGAHLQAMTRKSRTEHDARAGGSRRKPTNAVARNKKLFIAVVGAALAEHDVRPGEVAVEGAKILKTHPQLFRPLEITYTA